MIEHDPFSRISQNPIRTKFEKSCNLYCFTLYTPFSCMPNREEIKVVLSADISYSSYHKTTFIDDNILPLAKTCQSG